MPFITLDESELGPAGARLRVVGVGGAGGNALNSMITKGLSGVEFIAVNTDLQHLNKSLATTRIQAGKSLTKGLGAGADPTTGQRAAEESREEISQLLAGSDMVFVTAGMGGGTGTGGAPVVAGIAKSLGALVVGIVTKPFHVENRVRMKIAEEGIEELRKQVDTLIVIPNEKILGIIDRGTSLVDAFERSNQILYNAARGIAELITVPGLINVDFADVKKIMRDSGDALMGSSIGKGEQRAVEAAKNAISHPLLEGINIKGAKGVLINITGGKNLAMYEVTDAVEAINETTGDGVEVILGVVIDENHNEDVTVTVVATGFDKKNVSAQSPETPKRIPIQPVFPTTRASNTRDIPTYIRHGIQVNPKPLQPDQNLPNQIKEDDDRPAFLRKIMD